MSKTSDDVDKVVFDQPEEKAGTMEPDGLSTEPTQRGGMVGGHGALPWGPTQNNEIRPAGR